jgi:hypothetical protein
MGTVYCGPYADAIGYDDHEGYAARILPDGTETGTWTYETREFRGCRAHCACGWRGTATHPATDADEDAALDDWDRDHLRPLIQEEARRHVVTADVLLDVIHKLRTSATWVADTVTEHGRGVLDAAEMVEHLVADLARQEASR